MHKYEQVVRGIKQGIDSGEYPAGDLLPPAQKLCERYDVSKITIKRALDQMELEGLITRRKGSGAYVKTPVPAQKGLDKEVSADMLGFYAQQTELGKTVRTDVVDFDVASPPKSVAQSLTMENDEFAYYICRVRIADGTPWTIEYTYMPIKLFPDLRRHDAEVSLFSYINERTDYTIASSHRTIRAVKPTPEECRLLDVADDEPLLEIEQIVYFDDGRPFQYTRQRHAHGAEFVSVGLK
ncbi:MAG: GntR family transcriptional regulator [Atopobiaceae bacterium]|jgi:GntR family transcriptional regulator|nr:GntR family transcriptional regulator [Atopobiaceae bacterium]MCI2173330.1 GntR family transcriptional regulator [Atopobiaceae bacterium]MCI2207325.1 GntR family transcriptional regulator [Atopobiaceae bacterium]